MGLSDALRTRLVTAEPEKRELQGQIRKLPEDLPMIIPRLVERHRALLSNLPEVFKESPQTTRQALADLFGEVRIVQDGETIFAECQNLYGQALGVSKCGSGGPLWSLFYFSCTTEIRQYLYWLVYATSRLFIACARS
jgi:hypothetical protein